MSSPFLPQRPSSVPRHCGVPQRAATEDTVVVGPEDTLWSIAAEHLPPGADDWEIARAWPIWWEEHAELIGDNPGQLKPGTVLEVPAQLRTQAGLS